MCGLQNTLLGERCITDPAAGVWVMFSAGHLCRLGHIVTSVSIAVLLTLSSHACFGLRRNK